MHDSSDSPICKVKLKIKRKGEAPCGSLEMLLMLSPGFCEKIRKLKDELILAKQFAFASISLALLSAILSAFNGYFTVRAYYRVYTLDYYTSYDGGC